MTDQGVIPQSQALAEASPDSISELFSRDPEKLTEVDLGKLVLELRAQRERHKITELTAPVEGPRGRAKAISKTLITTASSKDMDL